MPFIYKIEPWKAFPVFAIAWWNKRKISFSSVASLICFIIYYSIENKKGTIFLCLKPNENPVPIRLWDSSISSHSRLFNTSKELSIRKRSWHFHPKKNKFNVFIPSLLMFIFTMNSVVFLYQYALLLKTERCRLFSNKENHISKEMVFKM